MKRDPAIPALLDDNGQQFWHAFMSTRQQLSTAKRELKLVTPAMRRACRPDRKPDPEITARYQAARSAVEDAEAARNTAERAYHAYRRVLLVRSLPHLQRSAAAPTVAAE